MLQGLPMQRTFHTPQIITISSFLSETECQDECERAQLSGFELQEFGQRRADTRRRAVIDHAPFAAQLWERLAPFVPPLTEIYLGRLRPEPFPRFPLDLYRPVGLNARLRYYRYEPGELFPVHSDIAYEATPTCRSFLTVIIYLNEGYSGGQTTFGTLAIQPTMGTALVFPHELVHEGAEVTAGVKCVLRSDVMFELGG
jgi:prolyl 4-hydroxylase